MEFNLQDFLRDMRAEQQQGFENIGNKVEKIKDDLAAHEKEDIAVAAEIKGRLQPIENLHKAATWLTRIGVGAIVTLIFDILKNHLPKLLAK